MEQASGGLPAVLFFDVNETLLDLDPLKESIDKILPGPEGATLWFTTMLQYSLVMTVADQYAPFPEIGIAVLKMLAKNRDVVLSDSDAKAAIQPMLRLPAHPDVAGLQRLLDAGVRMVSLTNSTSSGVKNQLEHAGITRFFERQLSVESLRKYKPHTDVYRWAAQEMQVPPNECMLVAAHGWDIAGAAWAGLRTAFIARSGQQIFPLAQPPSMIATDLEDFAQQMLQKTS